MSYSFLSNISKYLVEGIVVAIVAYYLTNQRNDIKGIVIIGVIAALTFAILDYFAPAIGASSRLGAGFGVGSNIVGFAGAQGLTGKVPSMPTWTGGEDVNDIVNDAETAAPYLGVNDLTGQQDLEDEEENFDDYVN